MPTPSTNMYAELCTTPVSTPTVEQEQADGHGGGARARPGWYRARDWWRPKGDQRRAEIVDDAMHPVVGGRKDGSGDHQRHHSHWQVDVEHPSP